MENIKSYLDGELDIAQKAEVETHLHNDAELQKMVEEFSAISTTLKTADGGEPYGLDKLEARLAAEPTAARTTIAEKKKIFRLASYWSIAGVLIALGGLAVMKSGNSSSADVASTMSGGHRSADDGTTSDSISAKRAAPGVMTGTPGAGPDEKAASPPVNGSIEMQTAPIESGKSAGIKDANATPAPRSLSDESPTLSGGGDSNAKQDYTSKAQAGINGAGGKGTGDGLSTDISTAREAQHRSTRGIDGGANSQSYGKKLPQPESEFKHDIRTKRDLAGTVIPGVPETEHGIFLERSGQIQVKVEDLRRSVNEATGMIASFDGFVTSSNVVDQENGGEATMTLRVPTKNFNATMDKLREMGERISENSSSQDITSDTIDSSTRMISWADEEKRLQDALAKAKTDAQRYAIRQDLANAKVNLAANKAKTNSLLERAKYSTINASFVHGDKATAIKGGGTGNWSGNALRDAKDNLSGIGQVFGTIAIYFLVFCPIWLPFAIAGFVIYRKNKS